MPPCDPNPYRTIAAKLREARDNRPAPTPAVQASTAKRSRHDLARYLERQRAGEASTIARDTRMQASASERAAFAPHAASDYHATPKPRSFSTPSTDQFRKA